MASRGINKVILVGNLGQDPEVRYASNGNAITNITLATSESYKDKNTGQMVDKTEWHRVVFFQKLAEIAGEYLRKGSQIYIEGKLETKKYTDNQGVEKYSTNIVVDGFDGKLQMLGGKEGGNQSQGQSNNQAQQQGGYAPQQGGYAPQQQQAPAQQKNNAGYNHGNQQQRPQQGYAPQQQQGGFNPNQDPSDPPF